MNRSGIALLILAAGPSAALAQTSELFINSFDSNQMVVVQGGSTIRSWNTINTGENALAVSGGEIREGGNLVFNNGTGYQYDTNGGILGGSYVMPGGGNWYDGTTDGQNYNYAIQHNGDFSVHRFDRNWGGDTFLFTAGGYPDSGISYDTTDDTLWISHAFPPTIEHYDLSGNPLGSFAAQGNYAYGLALDPADGTLWAGQYGSNVTTQYKKDGTYLGSVTVQGIDMAFGMEFDVRGVPAPGAAGLLGLGGLVAARRRR